MIIGCCDRGKEVYSTIIMSAQIESIDPISGMDGVFRVQYTNELSQRLQAGLVPIDDVTRFLTKQYYDVHGIGTDFLTPPEFFPETGRCYARLALRSFEQLGSPEVFSVFEAGGGNGTFMRGFLQEASGHESFFAALQYHVIEQSEGLMMWQQNHIQDQEQRDRIVWHNEDVTEFEFPEVDAAMYIALENDDDLPSKAVYKRNGIPQEVFLHMQTGAVVEEVRDPSPELEACIQQNSEWWSNVPENLKIYLPVHIESVKLRERFVAKVHRGLMVTTDYGYFLNKSGKDMKHWIFPLYDAFEHNKHLFFRGSPFESIFSHAGKANYTANVDFTLLSEPGRKGGYRTSHYSHEDILDQFGMRTQVEQRCEQMNSSTQEELVTYMKKLAYIIDLGSKGWDTLIQTKGFELNLDDSQQDLIAWFYELAERYQLGDVRPDYRRGPAR